MRHPIDTAYQAGILRGGNFVLALMLRHAQRLEILSERIEFLALLSGVSQELEKKSDSDTIGVHETVKDAVGDIRRDKGGDQ